MTLAFRNRLGADLDEGAAECRRGSRLGTAELLRRWSRRDHRSRLRTGGIRPERARGAHYIERTLGKELQ